MAKIDWNQLDDFDLEEVEDEDVLIYNEVTENYESKPQSELQVEAPLQFRRAMLLMGG